MSRQDELKRTAGGNMAESVGATLALGLPPGMSPAETAGKPAHLEGVARPKNLAEIAVGQIVRDEKQPREAFTEEEMDALVESVTARGVLQPIRVRWDGAIKRYVIIAGERRFRAARQAGLKAIPCAIHEGEMTESMRLQDQLVENLLRQDLAPIETARAYRRLIDLEGWSIRQLGRELHIPEINIRRALALLDLPAAVQEQVDAGAIAPSVAYEVAKRDTPEEQVALADRIVGEKLTRDAVQGRGHRAVLPLGDGRKITITGLPDDDPETVAAALRAGLSIVPSTRRHAS